MRSQTKWGLFFIAAGVILLPFYFPITAIYGVPLIVIGVALIFFRRREEIIEARNE